MKKHYTLLLLFFACFSLEAQVVINEFSAANYDDYDDNFGDNSDWIELYNAGSTSVDLEGYFLSDRQTNPAKWAFPAGVTIGANDHLRIWASKKDEVSGSNIHTNFKLTQTKDNEAIVFSDPDTLIVDLHNMTVPNQEGHSRGRETDGSNNWKIFTNPSPNASNSNGVNEYALTPVASNPAGLYSGSAPVELTTSQPDATIYYTIDGSTPDDGSFEYTGPLNIPETTVIRAIAYLPSSADAPPSFVMTNTYFVDEEHGMYIMSIAGDDIEELLDGDQFEPRGTFELFDQDGVFLGESTGDFNEHGNDSWAYPQRGLDYISRDQFGIKHGVEYPIFDNKDRDEYQRLILKAAASDNYPFEDGGCHIRDAYVQELSQRGELRLDERSFESAVMYVNGEYWGLYEIREKVDDNDFTDYYYDQDVPNIQFLKTWGGTWSEFGGNQSFTDWNNLHDYITSNDMSDTTHYNYVKSQLNTGSLIDYIILNTQIVNSDWLNWNTAWWRGIDPEGSKKKWRYALWDMDATFGHYANFTGIPDQSADADPCDNEELGGGGDPEGHTEMLTALYENPDFYDDYINRWADLNNTVFSCDNMIALHSELVGKIQPEMTRHIERWGGSESEWLSNVNDMRQFILARCAVIDEGIVDCYEVEGPYNLVVDVSPPGSGGVEVNSIIPTSYPYEGDYYGGVEIELRSEPNENWEFDHWEIKNQELMPDTLSESVFFNFEVGDTVVAFYRPTGIVVNVDFNIADTDALVTINDTIVTNEPWTGYFFEGDTINFEVSPPPGYEFESWNQLGNSNTLGPTIFDTDVFFVVNAEDSLTINLTPLSYEVTVITEGEGTVTLNGEVIDDSWTGSFFYDDLLDLTAAPDAGYAFNQWVAENNSVSSPFDTNTQITVLEGDTILVSFAPEIASVNVNLGTEGGGSISVNGEDVSNYPWTASEPLGTGFDLTATPDDGYNFVEWQLSDNTVVSDITAETINFALTNNLEITAIFEPLAMGSISINMGEVEGGSIIVNGEQVSDYPWSTSELIGADINLQADPEEGYGFVEWQLSDNTTATDLTAETINFALENDLDITAVFEILPVTVNITVEEGFDNGMVSINGTPLDGADFSQEVQVGTLLNLDATPNAGFVFDGWFIDGTLFEEGSVDWNAIIGGSTITLSFSEEYRECFVNMPTAFSPNGDGLNERFVPLTVDCNISDFSIKIYNRWGNEVFSSNDPFLAWDGTYNKETVSLGVYVWMMEYSIENAAGEITKVEDHGDIMVIK